MSLISTVFILTLIFTFLQGGNVEKTKPEKTTNTLSVCSILAFPTKRFILITCGTLTELHWSSVVVVQ
jgi:hypothetical protein